MGIKPESRRDLKDGVDKRKRKLDDREKHMTRVVMEKKAVADVSRKLRFPTKEGAAEIRKDVQNASVATQNEFKKQNNELKKIHKKCEKSEGDLSERTKIANQNALEAKKAEGKIKETRDAKNQLVQAEKVAKDDAHFTNDQRGRQKRRRERSEKYSNNLKARLMNTKLSF